MNAFRILFVCTGNVCRSPVAEILTRHFLDKAFGDAATGFAVASAGTACADGEKIHPRAAITLATHGLGGAADRFRTRRLDGDMAADADLVLAMERTHRRQVVTLEPAALPATFCVRELVRLLGAVPQATLPGEPVARLRTAVELARQERGLHGYVAPDADAIQDTLAQPPREYRAMVDLIVATVTGFVDFLKIPIRNDV